VLFIWIASHLSDQLAAPGKLRCGFRASSRFPSAVAQTKTKPSVFRVASQYRETSRCQGRVPRIAFQDSRVRLYCYAFVAHQLVAIVAEQAKTSAFAREVVFAQRPAPESGSRGHWRIGGGHVYGLPACPRGTAGPRL